MSLSDREPENRNQGAKCQFGKYVRSLHGEEAATLSRWLSTTDDEGGYVFQASAIVARLAEEDLDFSGDQVRRHRNHECKCR